MATADTTLTIYGLGHLAGVTVAVALGGVYMGAPVVATDGSVVVTYGSDSSAKVTAAYLITNFGPGTTAEGSSQDQTFAVFDGTTLANVTVPVLVGLPYAAYGQLIRPLDGGDSPALGRMRRANHVAILTSEAHEDLTIGTDASNLQVVQLTTDSGLTRELALADDTPFSGVLFSPINDGPSLDTQVLWKSAYPYRLTVALVSVFHTSSGR